MTEPLSTDQPFLRKLTDIVDANLSDENFGVDEFALESGYNHKVLNRKLRRLTGKSASQFIREVRLQKALEMLQDETLTASEVAYKVGFTSPDYFNRCFHTYFGYPPGRVKKEKLKNHEVDTPAHITSKSDHKDPYPHLFAVKKQWLLFLSLFIVVITVTVYLKMINVKSSGDLRSSDGRISIVVLPFQNMTNDTLWDVWENGIQTNLLTSLSNSEELKVRQIEAINGYLQGLGITENASINPVMAGRITRKLDAKVYICGSINKAGSTLRINAQMINSRTEENIKSFLIDGTEGNILHMIDSLSTGIMNSLFLTELKKNDSARYPEHYGSATYSPEAYRYFIFGQAAYYRNDFPTAVEWFLKALAIDSTLVGALAKISTAYYNLSDYARSKEYCLRYYKNMDRLNMQQKLWAEVLYCLNFKSFNESVKYLEQLTSLDDQQPITYFQLGDSYLFSGQFGKAIIEFNKAMEIFRKWNTKPFWVSFYCELGIAYHKAGLYGKEKKLYKQAEKDFPGDPSILDQQAWLFLTLGDTATAGRYIRQWISIRKDESWTEARIARNLAYIYYMAGMFEKEVEYCRLALSDEPENFGRMSTLAFVLVARDWNVKEGMELAEKVLKSNPDNFLSLHSLGLGLYKQGKYREACELLQKSWDLRMQKAFYNHEAFLHLEEAKRAAGIAN